ncbi:hypothetical protein CLOM_g8060 [Closterium sp. NIES-68]|nr:hypothetical protein CLOM_g8060 [Closterium sp. NIES-68]
MVGDAALLYCHGSSPAAALLLLQCQCRLRSSQPARGQHPHVHCAQETHAHGCACNGFFTGKSKPPLQVTLSTSLITFGCLIAALGDFSFDFYAYALALTSVLCQTFYLLLVEKSGAEQGMSSFELMFYNALLSLPFLGAILLCTNELPHSIPLLFTKCAASWSFTVAVITSLVMAIVLNYTMFLCTMVNSALTTP